MSPLSFVSILADKGAVSRKISLRLPSDPRRVRQMLVDERALYVCPHGNGEDWCYQCDGEDLLAGWDENYPEGEE